MIKWVLFLGGLPPLEYRGAKTVQNCAISSKFTLRSRMSPERMQISTSGNGIITSIISHVWRKKIGKVWSTNKKVVGARVDPPKVKFFERLYFDP